MSSTTSSILNKKSTRIQQGSESGYIVLITVLVLGAIATIIVSFLLITGQNSTLSGSSVVANTNAKAAATGCAELALSAIANNPTLATPSTSTQTVNSTTGASCTYTISGSSPNYSVAITGTVTQQNRSYSHRMTVTTNQVTPTVNVSSWQDTQ